MIKLEKDGIKLEVCDNSQAFPFFRNGWKKIESEKAPAKVEKSIEDIAPVEEVPVEEQKEVQPKRGRKPATKAE